jgi:hypothetical protein
MIPISLEAKPYVDYVAFRANCLTATTGVLVELPENRASDRTAMARYTDRDGAKKFEKDVTTWLQRPDVYEAAVAAVRSATEGMAYEFVRFEFIDDSNIAGKRAWYDIAIVATRIADGVEVKFPINIKATNGGTSDNSCGWQGFAFAMFGESGLTLKKKAIAKRLQESGPDSSSVHDYSFWNFTKGEDCPFVAASSFSLLEPDPAAYTFNDSQPFPVQINAVRIAANIAQATEHLSFAARQKRLGVWVFGNILSRAREAIISSAATVKAFSLLSVSSQLFGISE